MLDSFVEKEDEFIKEVMLNHFGSHFMTTEILHLQIRLPY